MLYLIYRANHPELDYRGGQGPIVHLEADLCEAVDLGRAARTPMGLHSLQRRLIATFQDRCDLAQLGEIDWDGRSGNGIGRVCTDGKQAEFLVERLVPVDAGAARWRMLPLRPFNGETTGCLAVLPNTGPLWTIETGVVLLMTRRGHR